jgi:hypothetical protein
MSSKLLPNNPICNIDEAINVFPFALITSAKLISIVYPHLMQNLKYSAKVAFVSLLWGIMFLDRHRNPTGIAQELGKISHDRLQNLRSNSFLTATAIMMELFQLALQLMPAVPYHSTMLILDDVLIPKPYAKLIQGAYWDHDHALNIPCFGIRVVVLLYSNGILTIPVAFLVWHKKQNPMPPFAPRRHRSKNELARILVYWVYRKGLRFCVLTFDAWYSKEENLLLFNRLGIVWVTALAPNRWIRMPLATPRKNPRGKPSTHDKLRCNDLAARYPRSEQYSNYPALGLRAKAFFLELTPKLRNLKMVIVKDYVESPSFTQEMASTKPKAKSKKKPKIKDPNRYLLTNRLDAPVAWVIRCYMKRYQIEWAFREAKQHLALGACSARKFGAVTQHIALSFLGFVCLQQLHSSYCDSLPRQVKEGLTLGEFRRQLQHLYRIRMGEIVCLVNLSEQCESPDDILTDTILYDSYNITSDTEIPVISDKHLSYTNDAYGLPLLDISTAA